MPRDLYAALGRPRDAAEIRLDGRGPDVPLRRDASQKEVDAAADAALLRHHPDRNPSDDGSYAPGSASARFRDAKLAREVLCDPDKRALYDAGLWIDPDDPIVQSDGSPDWAKAIDDPALREVMSGFVESACVLGGFDKDAAALAGDVTMGAVASVVDVARSADPIRERAKSAFVAASGKLKTPEGRAALREVGQSAKLAWRKLFA
jgi:curved DNA-binding protein CbpA